MNKLFRGLLFLLIVSGLVGCNKKEWDEYYDRPDWLSQPIYQQLSAKNNFKSFLTCIDKAGYKDILSKAGYWTIFAPNDDAFNLYLKESNFGTAQQIPDSVAAKIVKYSLVYNSFKSDRLSDYQSALGWSPGLSYKRRTTYYTPLEEALIGGKRVLLTASNRNNFGGTYYVSTDNNNKYIPYFTTEFFTKKVLTSADYTYFFPDRGSFSGFNVSNAEVVNPDMVAENGVIHEIDRVITPLPSLDQYLDKSPQYSDFRQMLNTYMASYVVNAAATAKNKEITGSPNEVFVKVFNSSLPYSPNNENFLKTEDNDGQMDGYTMFAPTNDALNAYKTDVLLKHYPTLDALPQEILVDFFRAHMWNTSVWPSKFASTTNSHGQGALFDPATDVLDKKVLSNGIFYGTNKVQAANVFSSVFGKAYLNPNYSLMTRAFNVALKANLINTGNKFTLFLISDTDLQAAGYTYDLDANTWRYTPPGGGAALSGSAAWDKFNRILNTHVLRQDQADISGTGIVETYSGEYIKFNGNKLQSAGNRDANVSITASAGETASNGTVYYVSGLLVEPTLAIGKHLETLAAANTEYKKFLDYLKASGLFNPTTGEIVGVSAGSFYTLFVPKTSAMDQAIADKLIPAVPADDKEKVANFIRYHILQKETVVPDGRKEGGYPTLLQKDNGAPTSISVTNAMGSMSIKDMKIANEPTRIPANVIVGSSNNLSNRAVIHLIDDYLRFDTK